MDKLVIVGCGRLANVIVGAFIEGLLPEYELVGVYSRTESKAKRVAEELQRHGYSCRVCLSIDELLTLKPHYLVETASPTALKECAIKTLRNGTSIIPLSIGAFADEQFYTEVKTEARTNNTRVFVPSGATGGFDILRAAALMGNSSASFYNEKGPNALKGTVVYNPSLQENSQEVFTGTARKAITMFPTKVNVAVAASLASVGAEQMLMSMRSTPGFVGDTQRVEIRNHQVRAVVDVYSATAEIAAWSVVSTLINIKSPIVF